MKKVIDTQANTVTFSFEGDLAPVVVSAADLSTSTLAYAALHGIAQKVGDNAAISKSAENNFTVTEAMRREKIVEMREQLTTHGWKAPEGQRAAPKNPTILAIAAKLGISYEAAQAKVAEQFLADIA